MQVNNLYPTPSVDKAKKHLLALIRVGNKNEANALITILQNAIIQEVKPK
jgi:hypothetical protein